MNDTPKKTPHFHIMVDMSKAPTGTVIGMDLGGTKLAAALFSMEGIIIHRTDVQLEGKEGPRVGALIIQKLQELLSFASERDHDICSVGICVPGISNQHKRTVWAPNIPGWESYPLHKEMEEALEEADIPVAIESDRNCYILGEMWKGNASTCKNAVFIAVGTGIGIGIVSNGHIINGLSGIAGAIGWMALDRPYKEEYDPCGQFEYHASGTGIARCAEQMLARGAQSEFLKEGPLTAREVFEAYAQQDPVAIQVLDQSIEYWGMAVANLVSLLNPEKIIFGGGVFGPAVMFLDRIYKEASKWAQPISIQEVKLESSALKGDTGLYGAGYLALKNKFIIT
jgi:glucokinase